MEPTPPTDPSVIEQAARIAHQANKTFSMPPSAPPPNPAGINYSMFPLIQPAPRLPTNPPPTSIATDQKPKQTFTPLVPVIPYSVPTISVPFHF